MVKLSSVLKFALYKDASWSFDLCTEHILQHELQSVSINLHFCDPLSYHGLPLLDSLWQCMSKEGKFIREILR